MPESASTLPDESAAIAAPAAPAPENAKASFSDRVRSDPEFAEGTVKTLQRQVRELQGRLKPLEQLEGVARATFGDVASGVTEIVGLADRQYRVEQNPEWKRRMEEMVSGKVPPAQGNNSPDDSEYLTPEEKEIRVLKDRQSRLEARLQDQDTRVSRTQVQSHIETVFSSDIGKAIEPAEREGVVSAIQQQFETWNRTEEGRRALANMTPKLVRTVIINHLDENGLLPEVYGRMARASQAKLSGAATDSPALSSRRVEEDAPEFKSHADALKWAAQKWIPAEDRQKLGSGW